MIRGQVEDGFPRSILRLPNKGGSYSSLGFIVDTGFAGDLAIPASFLSSLSAEFVKEELIRLADGSLRRNPLFAMEVDWMGEERLVEVTALREGEPLLGVNLLGESLLTIEMVDTGEVTVESL